MVLSPAIFLKSPPLASSAMIASASASVATRICRAWISSLGGLALDERVVALAQLGVGRAGADLPRQVDLLDDAFLVGGDA
jgi:hypothetical protein